MKAVNQSKKTNAEEFLFPKMPSFTKQNCWDHFIPS